jgi:hypothetical protein
LAAPAATAATTPRPVAINTLRIVIPPSVSEGFPQKRSTF